jgi:DnaK suppressor protein
MLSRAQLRALERSLRAARARLERSMRCVWPHRYALRLRGAPADRSDRTSARGGAFGARMLSRHQALVRAIRRLEEGTYGICAACEEPITYERLVAVPATTRCADCATQALPRAVVAAAPHPALVSTRTRNA